MHGGKELEKEDCAQRLSLAWMNCYLGQSNCHRALQWADNDEDDDALMLQPQLRICRDSNRQESPSDQVRDMVKNVAVVVVVPSSSMVRPDSKATAMATLAGLLKHFHCAFDMEELKELGIGHNEKGSTWLRQDATQKPRPQCRIKRCLTI
ncbi:hypothetical protein ACLKA7_001680 [Drosophila subpalustris]